MTQQPAAVSFPTSSAAADHAPIDQVPADPAGGIHLGARSRVGGRMQALAGLAMGVTALVTAASLPTVSSVPGAMM